MQDPAQSLDDVFGRYLPGKLAAHTLPESIAQGELKFVARAPVSRAWKLYAQQPGTSGGRFEPCLPEDPAACTITVAESDLLDLAEGQLNLQMAFMAGKLKVAGDMSCAMQLGALFG